MQAGSQLQPVGADTSFSHCDCVLFLFRVSPPVACTFPFFTESQVLAQGLLPFQAEL